MANGLFDSYKQGLLDPSAQTADLNTDTIKVALIDEGTTNPDLATHDFYDDLSSAVVGTPVTLTSITVTDGVFDAADATFTSVSGSSVEGILIYKDTGTPGTSPLIAYFDTGVTGLPITPSGGDITIAWNASGIFAL